MRSNGARVTSRQVPFAPVALGKYTPPTRRDVARVCGSDRIGEPIAVDATTTIGSVLATLVIEPALTSRLRKLASAYQKITYTKMVFRIVPQFSTATTGGYVSGFVRDAADKLPNVGTANYLITNTGASTASWWLENTIPLRNLGQFYTNKPAEGADSLRLYSPGFIAVVCDTPPNQLGYITIQLEWEAVLTHATTSDLEEPLPIAVPPNLVVNDQFSSTTSQGTIDYVDNTGTLQPVTTSMIQQMNPELEIQDGDVITIPKTLPMAMSRSGGIETMVMGGFGKFLSGKLFPAALNWLSGKVQVPTVTDWTTEPTKPLTNNYTNCPRTALENVPVSKDIALVGEDGEPMPRNVVNYIHAARRRMRLAKLQLHQHHIPTAVESLNYHQESMST